MLVRAILPASGEGQEMVTVLHYNFEEGPEPSTELTAADLQLLADRLRDDLTVVRQALLPPSWSVLPVEVVQALDPLNPSAPRLARTSGTPASGTRSYTGGTRMPVAAHLVAQVLTENVGRRHRGRIHIPQILHEADVDGDFATAGTTSVTAAQNFLNAIPLEPDLGIDYPPHVVNLTVYSRTARAQDQDPYAPDVTGFSLDRQVRWLRSRQPGQ